MTTLDDKLLGEKTHYYCSSSEDEGNDDDSDEISPPKEAQPKFIPSQNLNEWEGSSTNTGPKGVIKDWQRYKQLEAERREEQEQEKVALMKKLSLTCQSAKDEEKQQRHQEDIDAELRELLDDKILEEFKQMHMQQMMEQHGGQQSKFGSVFEIKTGEEYLDAVDRADKTTTVIVYIYNNGDKSCKLMYDCFHELAAEYPEVKFCCVEVTVAGLSRHFERRGVPAILIYKNGGLMGNFIRVTDELGDEFVTSDIENYLLEHGMLPDHSLLFSSIRKAQNAELSDSD